MENHFHQRNSSGEQKDTAGMLMRCRYLWIRFSIRIFRNHKSNFVEKSERLICWLLTTRREQGVEKLEKIINHKSANNLPKKFVKCFVSEKANIEGNDNIELVKLPFV